MSELILGWLNTDVGLSRRVTTFERDFASGYLFGELLHKHGLLQDSFPERFVDADNRSAKETNFSTLLDGLRTSELAATCKLNREQIQEIMDEDRGSSLRLLYVLRKGLEQLAGGKPKAATRKEAAKRLAKPKHGAFEERFFQTQMRTLDKHDPQVAYQLHLKPFVDEHTAQQKLVVEQEQKEMETLKAARVDYREGQLAKYKQNKEFLDEWQHQGKLKWQNNTRKKHALIEKNMRFEKEMISKEQRRIDLIRENHSEECGYRKGDEAHGIAWFEKNLQRIGIDTSEHSGADILSGPEVKSKKELFDKMKEKLPTEEELRIESTVRMKKIKEAKKAGDLARKERERRRRKVMVEQQATQKMVDERKKEEDLLLWLQRETIEYRKDAESFAQGCAFTEAERIKRVHNQTEYAVVSQKKMDAAFNREAIRMQKEHERKEPERLAAKKLCKDREKKHKKVKGKEHEDLCAGVLEELLQIAHAAKKTRKRTGGKPIPPDLWRQWTHNFIEGLPPEPPTPVEGIPTITTTESDQVASVSTLLGCIQDGIVADYLFARGAWQEHQMNEADTRRLMKERVPVSVPPATPQTYAAKLQSCSWPSKLGGLVRSLLIDNEAPTLGASAIPAEFVPIVGILANPLLLDGGKLVATRLCQDFGLKLLVPEEILQECIALAETEEQEPEWPPMARLYQLGKHFRDVQSSGAEGGVPHDLFAEMLVRKIELLCNPPPQSEEVPAEDPKAKKGKGQEAVKEVQDNVKPKSIAILNYPYSVDQCAAWESALRGYVSPFLRAFDSDQDMQLRVSALLAPWWVEEGFEDNPMQRLPEAPLMKILSLDFDNNKDTFEAAMANLTFPDEEGLQCEGTRQEFVENRKAIDLNYLHHEAQHLSRFFVKPLRTTKRVTAVVEIFDEGEAPPEPETLEDVYCKKATEELQKYRHIVNLDEEGAEEGGEDEEEAEEAQPLAARPDSSPLEMAGGRWHLLDPETKARLTGLWMECVSQYLTGLRSNLTRMHEQTRTFNDELVKMQQRFLEFLQRNDDKQQVLYEWLQRYANPNGRVTAEEFAEAIEDMNDQLWQFADDRRAAAVSERERLTTSGFWERHATISLRLVEQLISIEYGRHHLATTVLVDGFSRAHTDMGQYIPSLPETCGGLEVPTEGLDSLDTISTWVRDMAEKAAAVPMNFTDSGDSGGGGNRKQVGGRGFKDSVGEPSETFQELQRALLAEQFGLVRRLKAAEGRIVGRLARMREDLEEVFARMDMWITDRVKNENEAIKAVVMQIRMSDGHWAPMDLSKSLVVKELPNSVFIPPSSEGQLPSSSMTPGAPAGRWPVDMLKGVLDKMMSAAEHTNTVTDSQVLDILTSQYRSSFRFEQDCVPKSWIQRSEAALDALCSSLVNPNRGKCSVDVAELLLCLTFTERNCTWPDTDAIMRCRSFLESKRSSLGAKAVAKFPDVPIEEDVFIKFPLWGDAVESRLKEEHPSERSDAIKKWIFHILSTTEELAGNRTQATTGARTVSLRRIFGYLFLGKTPSEGFNNLLQAFPPLEKGMDEEVKIRSLWEMMFCKKMRPAEVVSEHCTYEDFLEKFQVEGEDPVEAVTNDSAALLELPHVVNALCSHGTLMCRYRLTDIFPESGQMMRLFPSTSLSEEPCGLRPSASLASLSAVNESMEE